MPIGFHVQVELRDQQTNDTPPPTTTIITPTTTTTTVRVIGKAHLKELKQNAQQRQAFHKGTI
jgi:hypothetical protein